ncbi:hypothetical protein [Actinotalea sp. C106]|uniref:hypothetical protein n=1 Tax=Actinotalea sp. C106 TaxID=2908644 RepID=UPI002028BAA0|nr:hypothetical protein [Actinotalea sp. C106]
MTADPTRSTGRTTPAPDGPTLPDDALADDEPLDLAQVAALVAAQQDRVRAATDVDGRVLYGAWGVAWVIGFLAMWLAAVDDPPVQMPQIAAGLIFFGLLVSAGVVTAVHIARRTAGVRGTSATQGEMYGWAWMLSFTGVGVLAFALGRLDASPEVVSTVMTVTSSLIVGALYMVGGAVWGDRAGFRLGAWISSVTVVAAVVGQPHMLLVMAFAGGGGMLLGAAAEHVQRRRREVPPTQGDTPTVAR